MSRLDRVIKFTIRDEGVEIEVELPARYEVCPRCEGEGTHLNPSIGEYAYSSEEFEREFDEDEREQYFKRGGIYDVKCVECNGERVVLVVDEDACERDGKAIELSHYREHLKEEAAHRRECEAERRMGA